METTPTFDQSKAEAFAEGWIGMMKKPCSCLRGALVLALLLSAVFRNASTGSTLEDIYEPEPSHPDATVATMWFDLSLELVERTSGFTPAVASRAFGYLGLALYEAVIPGLPEYRSLAGSLNGLEPVPAPAADKAYHWPTVANTTLAEVSRKLFRASTPNLLEAIDDLEETLAQAFRTHVDEEVFDRSVEHGRAVAGAIYTWSRSDGGHEGYAHNFRFAFHLALPDLHVPVGD